MSYRDSHLDRGQDYHDIFTERRDLAAMWAVESKLLDEIVRRRFGRPGPAGRSFRYLDFACGTGRILGHVEQHTDDATGVDISASALAHAATHIDHATLVEGDLTRQDLLGDRRFDLITSFRFFPNAEPELRAEVLAELVRHLAPGGALVFNNHQNARAIRRRLVKLAGRDPGHEMTQAEVDDLLAGAGLRIKQRWGIGLLPFSRRLMPLPPRLAAGLDQRLSGTAIGARFATVLLFECERA